MFVLFKWLLWLCMPYTLVMVALAALGAWLVARRQVKPALCAWLLAAALFVMGLPALSVGLGHALESKYPPTPLEAIPNADAIVLLGGGVGATVEAVPYPELYWAADRAVMAARLFRAGKAPLIIPTGGGAPLAEKPLLETLGVPASSIVCEDEARDTAENASKTFALLRAHNCKKALVVTSAWHLPRAMMLFKAEDIAFVPVGCDYESTLAYLKRDVTPLWQKLPGPEAAGRLGYYVKEWLGILFYSFRKPAPAPAKENAKAAAGGKAKGEAKAA